MRRIIKASMEDRSSMERFQFSLRCAVCGFLWESQPVRFSKAGMQPESEGKRVIFQALYRREREEAFEWAATEALEHFSLCPICSRSCLRFPPGRQPSVPKSIMTSSTPPIQPFHFIGGSSASAVFCE